MYNQENTWRFPEIGVTPNHPYIDGFSLINHPFWGNPDDYANPQHQNTSSIPSECLGDTSAQRFFCLEVVDPPGRGLTGFVDWSSIGGFHSHGGTPKAGWFKGKIPSIYV